MLRPLICAALLWPGLATAQEADKHFALSAPAALADSGLLDYLLPRFSLKTGIRITRTDPGDLTFGSEGRAAFTGPDQVWKIAVSDDPDAQAFADWLRSDVGRRTVDGFAVDGASPFSSEVREETVIAAVTFDGDAGAGAKLSTLHCGRCHTVDPANRMNSIGSTPSFMVLRAIPDWQDRFTAFYALNPHPAFTQIAEVTAPFDPARPSPIVPVDMTLDDLEAILAYVQTLAPADLGAPVQSR